MASDRERLESVIRGHVLEQLGCPDSAHSVFVRHLWADRYRVNVFVGEAAAFAEIAHSYFLSTDDEGKILESRPAIRRVY